MRTILYACAVGLWLLGHPTATTGENKKADAAELFAKAGEAMNFRAPGSPPLRLVEDVTVWSKEEGVVQGTYSLIWVDSDRWREELTLPTYHVLRIGGHQTVWRVPSRPFPTLAAVMARSVAMVWRPPRFVANESVDRIYEEDRGALTTKCVLLSLGEAFRSTYCFDSKQGYILSSTGRIASGRLTQEWGDFAALGGHWIPRLKQEFLDGRPSARVEVRDVAILSSVESDPFAPPPEAEQIEGCYEPDLPKPIRKPEPAYTSEARARRIQGTITLYLKIGRQGDVEDVAVLEPLDPSLNGLAVQTVRKKWKFRPASCRGVPVETEVEVQISFRLF